MERKLKTQSSYRASEQKHTVNNEPSLAVPDMNYSVRELLERFSTGTAPGIAKTPIYDENADLDNYDVTQDLDFDLADATQEAQRLQQIQDTRNKSFKEKQELKDKAHKEKMKRFEKWEKDQVQNKGVSEKKADNQGEAKADD